MDEHYDKELAANILERVLDNGDSRCLTRLFEGLDMANSMDFQVSRVEKPQSFVITRSRDSGLTPFLGDQNTFTVKGVLITKVLPPFNTDDMPRNVDKLKYKRQMIAISGLNVPAFDVAIRNLGVLHDILARHFPEGQMESWKPRVSEGSMIFEASNRLFTPIYDMKPGTEINCPSEWDFSSRIHAAIGGKFKFTEDNVVTYKTKRIEVGVETMYDVSPAKFRTGDIVEIEFMVTAVRVGKERYRKLIKMRSLILIDDSCSKLASLSRIQMQMNAAKESGSKRLHSDIEDDDNEAIKSVSRMRIDA